jgi:hypothetical protein
MTPIIKITCKDQIEKKKLENFLIVSEVTLKIRDRFFKKWRENHLYTLVENKVPFDKLYLQIINSDIATSGSYLDSVYCDVLYGDLATRHEDSERIKEINRYLNHSHIFTLFIVARSIILNTAYINAYYNLKEHLESYTENTFAYLDDKFKDNAEDGETLIETFQNVIDIFDLKNGDQISILSNFKTEINTILESKIKSKTFSELQLVKLLQHDIFCLDNHNLKNNELMTLYELSSKSFHRHEALLYILNNWCNGNDNQNTNIDLIINNTILRIIKICTLLYGYQIDLMNKLLKQSETNIITDFPDLMKL